MHSMPSMSARTSIACYESTRKRLDDFRRKDESLEDALNRALDLAEKHTVKVVA